MMIRNNGWIIGQDSIKITFVNILFNEQFIIQSPTKNLAVLGVHGIHLGR
jgi:hypothetical protein